MTRGQLYSPSSSSSHLEGQTVALVVVGPVGPSEVQGVLDIALPVVEPTTTALLQKPGLEPPGIWHQGTTFILEIPMLSVPIPLQKGDTGCQGCRTRNSPSAQLVVPVNQRPPPPPPRPAAASTTFVADVISSCLTLTQSPISAEPWYRSVSRTPGSE